MDDEVEVRIEAAREGDTSVVLRMIRALVEYERLSHELTVTESALRQALFGPRSVVEASLGYVGADPVGLAVYFPTYSTASGRAGLYLEDLYVEPEWRGRGIGRKLFAHVAKLAAARGGGGVSFAVLEWNDRAIRFYQALGAEPIRDALHFRLAGEAFDRLAGGR